MSTDPPSPSRVAKGDGPFVASLYFDVHHIMYDRGILHGLKPPDDASYSNTDIFACPNPGQTNQGYYIFDTKKFTPSPDHDVMKSTLKKLYDHLKLSGKAGDGEVGSKYFNTSLRDFGPMDVETKFQPRRFLFKCSCSDLARKKASKQKECTSNDGSYKLAATNNTRTLFGRHGGNKGAPRKSCKYNFI